MGLAERRAAKKFEDTLYPPLKQQVETAAHFAVPVDVNWQSLATDEQAHLYDECWPKVYFTPLIEALEGITTDDMGRDALKAGLHRIVIRNTGGIYSASGAFVTFEGGVLTLDHEPCTNVDDTRDRRDAIQKTLEKAL
ncbi:hypothetical protein JGU66_05705 [Myxococcaceae bacterium JPH2]|nr:hypothetical protein [Myxococcaceae bacterium JPH2]